MFDLNKPSALPQSAVFPGRYPRRIQVMPAVISLFIPSTITGPWMGDPLLRTGYRGVWATRIISQAWRPTTAPDTKDLSDFGTTEVQGDLPCVSNRCAIGYLRRIKQMRAGIMVTGNSTEFLDRSFSSGVTFTAACFPPN